MQLNIQHRLFTLQLKPKNQLSVHLQSSCHPEEASEGGQDLQVAAHLAEQVQPVAAFSAQQADLKKNEQFF